MNANIEIGSRRVSKKSVRANSSVLKILRYYWRRLQLNAQVRRERRQLGALSSDQLDDIGISRQQARREAYSRSLSPERLSTL
jgi:uncharacterized protein YjiS (DUF1127 family)